MTKNEALKLQNPSEIWDEMQKNSELRVDRDVWLHLTRLTAKINREWSQQRYGGQEAYLYIDPIKKKSD